jgi:hypothetical protein
VQVLFLRRMILVGSGAVLILLSMQLIITELPACWIALGMALSI